MAYPEPSFSPSPDDLIKPFVRNVFPKNGEAKVERTSDASQSEANMALENAMRVSSAATRARNQYLQSQVETASPTRLVVMLYEGAIRFCHQGMEAMNTKRYEDKNYYLVKAQRIVSELLGSLNREAGEVSGNLMRIYMYMLERLVDANVQDNPQHIQEVIGLLDGLRESWVEVDRIAAQSSGTEGLDIRALRRPEA